MWVLTKINIIHKKSKFYHQAGQGNAHTTDFDRCWLGRMDEGVCDAKRPGVVGPSPFHSLRLCAGFHDKKTTIAMASSPQRHTFHLYCRIKEKSDVFS